MKPFLLLPALSALALAAPTPDPGVTQLNVTSGVSLANDRHYIQACANSYFGGQCGFIRADAGQCVSLADSSGHTVSSVDTHGRNCTFYASADCNYTNPATPSLNIKGKRYYVGDDLNDEIGSYLCTAEGINAVAANVTSIGANNHPVPDFNDPHNIVLCKDKDLLGIGGLFRANPYECVTLVDLGYAKTVTSMDLRTRTCVFSTHPDCAYFFDQGVGGPGNDQYTILGKGNVDSFLNDKFVSYYCTDEGLWSSDHGRRDVAPQRLDAALELANLEAGGSSASEDPRYIYVCTGKNFGAPCAEFLSNPNQCVSMFPATEGTYYKNIVSIDTRGRKCHLYWSLGCQSDGDPYDFSGRSGDLGMPGVSFVSWWCD
ncbi:hypothetical protein OQA88_13518 [Cercophora sp. LCS_1]